MELEATEKELSRICRTDKKPLNRLLGALVICGAVMLIVAGSILCMGW